MSQFLKPSYLKSATPLLNLNGAVITLNAMGTQLDIVRQIKVGGGDYVIGLKGNQGKLNQGIRD
jgi:predicted transposase YbfD/YdcC